MGLLLLIQYIVWSMGLLFAGHFVKLAFLQPSHSRMPAYTVASSRGHAHGRMAPGGGQGSHHRYQNRSNYDHCLLLQGCNEFLSLQPRLLHNRNQCAFCQLWMIRNCNDQISFFIPEMNMAAGLSIDLKSKLIQSLDGSFN